MTPLEELQAAHKRLSEMSAASRASAPWPWAAGETDVEDMVPSIEASHGLVAHLFRPADRDLIVTLHRTIDAQLAVLERAITREHVKWGADVPALGLARAINGEAS